MNTSKRDDENNNSLTCFASHEAKNISGSRGTSSGLCSVTIFIVNNQNLKLRNVSFPWQNLISKVKQKQWVKRLKLMVWDKSLWKRNPPFNSMIWHWSLLKSVNIPLPSILSTPRAFSFLFWYGTITSIDIGNRPFSK